MEEKSFSENDYEFRENMIKGRLAETLIEELFLSLNWSVFRYGMENTVPGIINLLKGVRGDVAVNIKRMPDFVIRDKNGEFYFIEVKFRANEKFDKSHKSVQDYPYKNCFFIVVSKNHIKCISYDELQQGEEIAPASNTHYLGNRKEFNFSDSDKEIIKTFCKFAEKFFVNV